MRDGCRANGAIMKKKLKCLAIIGSLTVCLTGCGGGSGGGSTAISPPSSGIYGYTLKAQGSTGAPTFGISLVHPSAPGVEFKIEPATSAISDVKVVSSGTVNATTGTVSNILPHSLLYIEGGDVRRLPLVANGAAPLTQVKKSGSTTACKFVVDGNDYATPDNSRFIVSTAGADGVCGTADDGQGEITLDTAGGVHFANKPVYWDIGAVIGMLRDTSTLSPKAWVQGNSFYIWSPQSMTIIRNVGDPLLTRVVAQTVYSVVAEYNNQLTVISYSSLPVETKLNSVITAGTGWQSIGFDDNNYYVYRNSGTTTASNWTVLKISRTNPVATQLSSGTGLIQAASMGSNLLYVTVLGTTSNSLLTINKTIAASQTFESTATSTLSTVLTSNSGVHQLWRISGMNSTPSYTINMIDEMGISQYSTAGGFPMAMSAASTVNLNLSENRSRFVFASGYGLRGFGDASLVAYDAASKSATILGQLPGAADFGANPVYASLSGTSSNFMTGFATSILSGSLQSTGARVFTVDLSTVNSLKCTTSTQ